MSYYFYYYLFPLLSSLEGVVIDLYSLKQCTLLVAIGLLGEDCVVHES